MYGQSAEWLPKFPPASREHFVISIAPTTSNELHESDGERWECRSRKGCELSDEQSRKRFHQLHCYIRVGRKKKTEEALASFSIAKVFH